MGRRGHQRLARPAAGRHPDRRGAPERPASGRPSGAPAGDRRGSGASARRPAPAAGAWSRRCSSRARRRPSRPTRRPCNSSSATASSPARRCSPRASSAGTPRCTACSRCSRSAARCGAATSSAGSARPSSPCRARSTGCGRRGARRARPPSRRSPVLLSATDPAQPYGATLAGRSRPGARRASAPRWWCSADGVPLVWYDRRSHHLVTFPQPSTIRRWADALADLVQVGRAARRRDPQGRRRHARRVSAMPHGSAPRPSPAGSPTATTASPSASADRARRTISTPTIVQICTISRPRTTPSEEAARRVDPARTKPHRPGARAPDVGAAADGPSAGGEPLLAGDRVVRGHRRARRRGPPRVHRALGTMGRSVVGPRQRGRRRHHLVHPGGHGRRPADAPTGPCVRRRCAS